MVKIESFNNCYNSTYQELCWVSKLGTSSDCYACHWTWSLQKIPLCVCRTLLGWGWFWWPGSVMSKCPKAECYLRCFLLPFPSSSPPPPPIHSTRNHPKTLLPKSPSLTNFCFCSKLILSGQNTLEALKTDFNSDLPLSGCGLLASSLMFLSLNFWFCTMGMSHTHCAVLLRGL